MALRQSGGCEDLRRLRQGLRALAIRIRDEFLPKAALQPDTISGVESVMADAIAFKFLAAPLSKEQLAEVIQIPPRAK